MLVTISWNLLNTPNIYLTLFILKKIYYYHALLVRWSLNKYKCLWDVESKGRGSSF